MAGLSPLLVRKIYIYDKSKKEAAKIQSGISTVTGSYVHETHYLKGNIQKGVVMKNRLFRKTVGAIFFVILLFFCSTGYAAENIDPDNDGSQYAYGENVGWLNGEPDGNGGPGVEVSDLELTGYIWGENIGWINLSPT